MSRRPHLLVLQRTYPPLTGAAGDLLADLCEYWVRDKGWWITVVCGGGRKKRLADKVHVMNAPALPYFRKPLPLRALSTVSLYPGIRAAARGVKEIDAVLSLSDPPLVSVIGDWIACSRSVPHFIWCQDLYPDVAVAAGVLREKSLSQRALSSLATNVMQRASRVIVPGRCMQERLAEQNALTIRSTVIPNWPLPAKAHPTAIEIRACRKRLAPPQSRLLLYAGNLGSVHEFDTMLAAMADLHQTAWHLAIVGSGSQAASVRRRISSMSNVTMHQPVPAEELPALLAAADVHLVTLACAFAGLVVPSKLITATGAAKPVLFIGPEQSEGARFLRETGAGLVFANGASQAFAHALRGQDREAPPFKAEAAQAARVANSNPRARSLRQLTELVDSLLDPK